MKLRPRFSLRTLLVLVTLTCIYFAAWEVTKRRGAENLKSQRIWGYNLIVAGGYDVFSPMPFVLSETEHKYERLTKTSTRHHHIWFFGWTWKTPIQWEVKKTEVDLSIIPPLSIQSPEDKLRSEVERIGGLVPANPISP